MTSATPSKSPARKAPTDRKKSAEALRLEAIAARPAGAELMRPVETLRSREMAAAQADILDLFSELGIDLDPAKADEKPAEPTSDVDEFELSAESEDADADAPEDDAAPTPEEQVQSVPINGDTLRAIGNLSEVLERYVQADQFDAFIEFDTGKGAQQRVMELAMWFLNELGE